MFRYTIEKFGIDVKKMPIDKLYKGQIDIGFDLLNKLEIELKANREAEVKKLSSRFYKAIPHTSGGAEINTMELLRKKMDMLLAGDEAPNPLDVNYGLLNCSLTLVEKKSKEYKIIEKYTNLTSGEVGRRKFTKIKDVWLVDIPEEDASFAKHDDTGNRKLLWHGTRVASVAAILKNGPCITSRKVGRLGVGIYFASENRKAAHDVGVYKGQFIMFLNEVVLGKQYETPMEESSLEKAPDGYDSVVGQGKQDPKEYTQLKFGKHYVDVPQSKPVANPGCDNSVFDQSEYVVYKESQNRIRYLLLFENKK